MKEPATEQDNLEGRAEWFADWLPPAIERERLTAIEEVRSELKAVAGHLIDPSAYGVEACIPHLERAVAAFGSYFKMKEPATSEAASPSPTLDALRSELALATTLFENAYVLQAAWAAQSGLNLDGTPRQLLYSRPGQAPPRTGTATVEVWEG